MKRLERPAFAFPDPADGVAEHAVLESDTSICTDVGIGVGSYLFDLLTCQFDQVFGNAPLFDHVRRIVAMRAFKQVARSDARRIIAVVTNIQDGPVAVMNEPRNTVGEPVAGLVRGGHESITVARCAACPYPARPQFGAVNRNGPILVNVSPKASIQGHSQPKNTAAKAAKPAFTVSYARWNLGERRAALKADAGNAPFTPQAGTAVATKLSNLGWDPERYSVALNADAGDFGTATLTRHRELQSLGVAERAVCTGAAPFASPDFTMLGV